MIIVHIVRLLLIGVTKRKNKNSLKMFDQMLSEKVLDLEYFLVANFDQKPPTQLLDQKSPEKKGI